LKKCDAWAWWAPGTGMRGSEQPSQREIRNSFRGLERESLISQFQKKHRNTLANVEEAPKKRVHGPNPERTKS